MESGQITIEFAEGAIDVSKASQLPTIGCGGESIFIGRTRPETHSAHGSLHSLTYDCYKEMAVLELQKIAEEAINRYAVQYVRVTHAVGTVGINEASVVIAVSSHHRADAFTACHFIIDLLKQRVPIWKQEDWEDGTTWKEGHGLEHE